MSVENSIDAKLASLSPAQRMELLQRVAAKRSQRPRAGAASSKHAPLSFAQSNLWVMNEVEGEQYKYNMVSAYSLSGELDVAALERALALIVERHLVLRTRFVEIAGEPMQEVVDDCQPPLTLVDLTADEPQMQEARLQELLLAEGRWIFDLARGPLLRVHLYRLASDHHVLQLNVHHAIFDGWSKGLLFRELEIAYRALRAGQAPDLPPLSQQFTDYARWQRERMSWRIDEQLAYWRRRLSGAPPLLNLPTDFPRPPARSSEGAVIPMRIDARLSDAIRELARGSGATLFMTMLGAFMLLLHRCTGQADICVATPVDNRNDPQLRKLIGYFLNTVVLRMGFGPQMSTRSLIRSIRQCALEAFQHQDAPFERVVSEVAQLRSRSFSPLNQVMFVFQHSNAADPDLAGLQTTKLLGGNETTKYDIYATFKEAEGGLHGWLTYRTDLFRPATLQSFAANFQTLLEQMTADPDRPVHELALMSAGERAQVLALSCGARHGPQPAMLHERFAACAARYPERIAAYDGNTEVTFATVERQATQLSAVLRRAGVEPGAVVGLHARRGAWYVQAQLAIWKAGATVVPLDTLQPIERLRGIVTRVEPCLILHDLDTSPPFAGRHRTLSQQEAAQAAANTAALPADAQAAVHAPAFVLFTSGSTGEPKGVVGTHAGLVNRVEWQWREFPPLDHEIVAQRANIGFVDSLTEIWATLLAGGSLAVIDDQTLRDPFELVDAWARRGVTTLYIVPSLLGTVLEAFPELGRRLPQLQRLVLSGEALSAQLVARVVEALPGARILNVYGATEAADASAAAHDAVVARERVPIGRPLSNMNLYVLDDSLQLCPTGVEGTLYVSGPSVALGYWRDPRLTAERFIPDCHAGQPGARMYCLGDRARRLSDGTIEYLGRRDHQLKLRGLRIETAEIETAIEKYAGVVAACVIAVPTGADDSALVAYVHTEQDARVDRQVLTRHLQARLPDYMQPNALVLCTELPRSAAGKVDREALRARGLPDVAQDPHVEPRTPTQRAVAQIWQDVLRLKQVSINASFFDLGGHSLLAMRVSARIREQLGVRLSAQELFQLLTIANVAERIDAQLAGELRPADGAEQALDVTEF